MRKTGLLVSEQVMLYNPEYGLRIGILDLGDRGIVLSM